MKKLLLSLFAVLTASFATAQDNLLTNGGFEEWTEDVPTGWLISAVGNNTAGSNVAVAQSNVAHGGTYAVALTNTTADKTGSSQKNGRISTSEIKLKAGTYTFSIYMRATDADGAASRIGYTKIDPGTGKPGSYYYSKNENGYNTPDTLTTEWLKKTYEFTLKGDSTVCLVVMHSKNMIDKTVLLDDASLTTTDGGIDDGTDPTPTPQPEGAITIAEAMAKTTGNVTVVADVYAVSTRGFVLGDATGFMYAYKSNAGVSVGDNITVEGALSQYGGFTQFNNPGTITKNGTTAITYPTPTVLDGAALDAWYATPAIKFVKVTGTLKISGNYFNLEVEGATKAVGSLINPTTDVMGTIPSNSKVDVEGFAMYTSGGKYVNIVATKVTITEEGETKDISNTPETAYTTSEAKAIVDEGLGLEYSVYVKGTVVGENLSISTEFHNANYYITDGTYQLYVFRGRFLENHDFTAEDQLKEGDEVIIYGKLQNYEKVDQETGTKTMIPEFTQGNYIYSLNGETVGIRGIATEQKKSGVIFDLSGRRVAKAQKGIYIVNGKKVVK